MRNPAVASVESSESARTAAAGDSSPVPAIARAMRVLTLLEDLPGGETVSNLARGAGVAKSTASNLLRAMRSEGLVSYEETTGRYDLGPALVQLGAAALGKKNPTIAVARQYLHRLTENTKLTSLAMVRMPDGHFVVVEEVESTAEVKVKIGVGTRFPPDSPLVSRLWSAWDDIETPEPTRYTKFTITDRRRLNEQLEKIRCLGYGTSYGEYTAEFNIVGALVFERGARPVLALLLIATGEEASAKLEKLGPMLCEAGIDATRATGGSLPPGYPRQSVR